MMTVKSQFLGPFLSWYDSEGWPAREVVEREGGDPSWVGQDEVNLPHATYCAILDGAERAAAEVGLGLAFAQSTQRMYAFMEALWQNSPDVRTAMSSFAAYSVVMSGRMTYTQVIHEDRREIVQTCASAPLRHERVSNEFMIAWFIVQLRRLVREDVVPLEVAFAHPEPNHADLYCDLFCTPHVRFGEDQNRFALSNEVLDMPIVHADQTKYDELMVKVRTLSEHGAPQDDFTRRLRQAISERLERGHPAIDEVARAIGVSGRSLQRKLMASETSFRAQVDEVRRDLAIDLLANHPVREAARRIGYEDDTAFIRAFKRWTGETPGRYARRD